MAKIKMQIGHHFPKDEALSRIKRLLSQLQEQFAAQINDLQEHWNGDRGDFSFSVMGMSVSGVLRVTDSNVEIEGDLPMAVALFKGRIESAIRANVEGLLSHREILPEPKPVVEPSSVSKFRSDMDILSEEPEMSGKVLEIGLSSVHDSTEIQKSIARLYTLSEEQLEAELQTALAERSK